MPRCRWWLRVGGAPKQAPTNRRSGQDRRLDNFAARREPPAPGKHFSLNEWLIQSLQPNAPGNRSRVRSTTGVYERGCVRSKGECALQGNRRQKSFACSFRQSIKRPNAESFTATPPIAGKRVCKKWPSRPRRKSNCSASAVDPVRLARYEIRSTKKSDNEADGSRAT